MKFKLWKIIHPVQTRRVRRTRFVYEPTAEDLARWEAEDAHCNAVLAANPDVAAKIAAMRAAL